MSEELNPYESPKTIDDSTELKYQEMPTVRPMVNTKFFGGFSRGLLGTFLVLCLLLAIWDLKLADEYDLTEEYEGLAFLSFDQMSLMEASFEFIFFGSVLAVAFWKFKSMQNAWAMMRSGMQPTVTPGWAIAWYIIPIAFLWKPFTAMSEINKNSMSDPKKLKLWLGFWWGLWILSFFTDDLGSGDGEFVDADDLQLEALGLLIIGAAAGCLERIIAHITKEQMAELDKRARVKQV